MATSYGSLQKAVGESLSDGIATANLPSDVKIVKQLLNANATLFNLSPLLDVNNPDVGKKTKDAIRKFQSVVLGQTKPSGRVRPNAETFKRLLQGAGAGGGVVGKVIVTFKHKSRLPKGVVGAAGCR